MSPAEIDFTTIIFPSDRLTVGRLRVAHRKAFDLPGAGRHTSHGEQGPFRRMSIETALGGMIDAERELARRAFKQTLGQSTSAEEAAYPRLELAEDLAADYEAVGLAFGRHQFNELIREIESQAVAQARKSGLAR
jgi:hypothetical protein